MAARRKLKKAAVTGTALIRRLQRLPTAVVSDVLDVMGLPNQVLTSAIRPVPPVKAIAGPAFCLRGEALAPGAPPPAAQYEADRQVKPGMIAVMATGSYTAASVCGGNVAASYRKHGCAAMVLHGAVRDAAEMRRAFPVFATGVTPVRPAGRYGVVAFGEPIELPGQAAEPVIIHPGDLVLADGEGVVIVPQAIALEVVEAAEKLERLEAKVLADIRRGKDRGATLKRHDRYGHIRRIVP